MKIAMVKFRLTTPIMEFQKWSNHGQSEHFDHPDCGTKKQVK
jgi:hypothetical protein